MSIPEKLTDEKASELVRNQVDSLIRFFEQHGISDRQIGRELGLTHPSISAMRQHRLHPTMKNLLKLSNYKQRVEAGLYVSSNTKLFKVKENA